jgi:hypothetical protein
MQLGAKVFIIPWKALYMFWALFIPTLKHVECFPSNNKAKCSKLHHLGCFSNYMMMHRSTNIKFI